MWISDDDDDANGDEAVEKNRNIFHQTNQFFGIE